VPRPLNRARHNSYKQRIAGGLPQKGLGLLGSRAWRKSD